MKTLLVVILSICLSSSLCDLLPTIASVHLVQSDQLHPLSQIYEDPQTLKHKETAVISLKFADHQYFLDLTKGDDVISSDFVHVMEDGETSTNVEHNLFEHCAYNGVVRGFPHSEAHLFTCGGVLRGAMRIHNTLFSFVEKEGQTVVTMHDRAEEVEEVDEVEEAEEQPRTEEEKKVLPSETDLLLNFTDNLQKRQSAPINVIDVWYVVAPSAKKMWASFGWTVQDAVRTEFFIANDLYKPLGLKIQCIGITESPEIFPQPAPGGGGGIELLRVFHKWQLAKATPVRDWQFYQTGLTLVGSGRASMGSVCRPETGSGHGNILFPHVYSWAETFAHELGHGVGMPHDDQKPSEKCCPQGACVMGTIQGPVAKLHFSQCSIRSFKVWLAKQQKSCLKPLACTNGEWSQWDSGKCGGGWMFRQMSASNGCVGPRELKPRPLCNEPTPPRMGLVHATPREVFFWACDPNSFATIGAQVRVPSITAPFTPVQGSPGSDHIALWDTNCPVNPNVPYSSRGYAYRFDIGPPMAVGTKIKLIAFGVNNAGARDGQDGEMTVTVTSAPKAVSEQDDSLASSEEKAQTTYVTVQALVGVVVGCSIFVIIAIIIVAVVLSKRRREERA